MGIYGLTPALQFVQDQAKLNWYSY